MGKYQPRNPILYIQSPVKAVPFNRCDRLFRNWKIWSHNVLRPEYLHSSMLPFCVKAGNQIPFSKILMHFRCPKVLIRPKVLRRSKCISLLYPFFKILAAIDLESFSLSVPRIRIRRTKQIVLLRFLVCHNIRIPYSNIGVPHNPHLLCFLNFYKFHPFHVLLTVLKITSPKTQILDLMLFRKSSQIYTIISRQLDIFK